MSKKTFKTPPRPQPSIEAMERFVHEGPGRDVLPAEAGTQKAVSTERRVSVPQGQVARLTVDMPKDLHRRFKGLCSLSGLTMNDEIRQFIERRTAELEAEQGRR